MGTETRWESADARLPPKLTAAEAHLWLVNLDESEKDRAILSAGEIARADRFLREMDRDRYIAAHAALRTLLAGYVGCEAAAVGIETGPAGKPSLAAEQGDDVKFSLSHSGGCAAIAVARGCEVGVDVELPRPQLDVLAVAEQFFAPAEADAVRTAPEDQRIHIFLAYWTAKEAFVKATGRGFSMPLRSFEVRLDADPPAIRAAAGEWSLSSFALPADGWGALVLAGRRRPIRYFHPSAPGRP